MKTSSSMSHEDIGWIAHPMTKVTQMQYKTFQDIIEEDAAAKTIYDEVPM